MKIILEFDETQRSEGVLATHAIDLASCITDIQLYFRNAIKYENLEGETLEIYEKIYSSINDIINDLPVKEFLE